MEEMHRARNVRQGQGFHAQRPLSTLRTFQGFEEM